MAGNNKLVLIGFMGCGKTTVSRLLKDRLQWELVDTDEQIERDQAKTIVEIFKEDGEAAFRQMETETLKRLLNGQMELIVSSGGGLPMREENRSVLKESDALVIYLRVRPDTVYERLKGDTTRPLLMKDDPEAEIRKLLAMRAPIYEECADVIVDVDGLSVEKIVERIVMKL